MSEQNIQDLLRQGVEAAREGQKAQARKLFKQVIELDANNEKAWYGLAQVADSDTERRDALEKVIEINPGNERAEQALQKVRGRLGSSQAANEVVPGINSRQLLMFGGGGLVIILLIVVIFIVVNNSHNAQVATDSAAATGTYAQFTAIAQAATNDSINQTATQAANLALTPQPTSTFQRATLPPTFTAQPSATPLVTATPLPPPSGLTGRIFAWSGQDISKIGYLPVGYFDVANGGQFTAIPDMIGRDPQPSADGQNVIFTQYFPVTFDFGIGQVSLSGSNATVVTQGQDIFRTEMPSYCPTTPSLITFVGLSTDQRDITFGSDQTVQPAYQVFTLDLTSKQLNRLTNDKVTYTYPAFSPDCSKIAVVRNDNGQGADIVLIDAKSYTQTPVTNDLGSFTEQRPLWSPDGTQLIYSASPSTNPNNGDVIIRPADGSGTPLVPIHDPSNDVFPVLSPDGRYIAFSSDRDGFSDIFIFDQTTSALYQLTYTPDEDYPTAWTK